MRFGRLKIDHNWGDVVSSVRKEDRYSLLYQADPRVVDMKHWWRQSPVKIGPGSDTGAVEAEGLQHADGPGIGVGEGRVALLRLLEPKLGQKRIGCLAGSGVTELAEVDSDRREDGSVNLGKSIECGKALGDEYGVEAHEPRAIQRGKCIFFESASQSAQESGRRLRHHFYG